MTLQTRMSDADRRLALEGELTIYTVADSLERLHHCLQDRQGFDLDLSGVTELDAAGLQLLLWTKRTTEEQGIPFRLVSRSDAVSEVIALLQLEPILGADPIDPAQGVPP